MFRFSFVVLTIILSTRFATTLDGADRPRPNVLMILVDDLKPALGCYGDPVAKTPHMDALAARGMRLDRAYCNQAVCAPSRFTLMLGSHSTSTGLYGLGSQLRQVVPDAVTLPQHFATHGGYRTESLGKVFHIGHGNHGDPESFSVPHFHDKVIEYLDPASTQGGKLTREEAYFTNQKLGNIHSLPRGAAFESPDVADNAYADGRAAEETVNRLRAAKSRRESDGTPFFVVAGFARPHLPFSAPRKYWDLYDPTELPMPTFEALPHGAPKVAGKRGGEIRNYFPVPDKRDPAKIDNALKRQLIHGYYASISYVDAQIGKVIDGLDRLQLADNTIVVLWGDHGFHLGDLGIWTKHTNYEQANRIPILIAAPGVTKAGTSTNQLAESVDIFPTLAELAGLPKPAGPQSVDGVSLVPVLKDPRARVRDHAFHVFPKRKLGRAIRTERYRLVQWQGIGQPAESVEYELYDYETDPLETRNLAGQRPAIVEELKSMLATYPPPVGRDEPLEKKKRDPTVTQIRVPGGVGRKSTKPFQSALITKWGKDVSAENAWTEYPRPQIKRGNWTNLNGQWDYAITAIDQTEPPSEFTGKILVPYCLESKLGGVGRLLDASEALWYRRTIDVSKSSDQRQLMNFEAVDYACEVFINGQSVGTHVGGHTPFSIDITDAVRHGQNELIVRVEDATEGYQLRGKQVLDPRGIWYTQVSGIWQTVWLETVAASHLVDLNIRTDANEGSITIAPEIEGRNQVAQIRVAVKEGETTIGMTEGSAQELKIELASPKLWSPSSPHLYDLEVSLLDSSGKVVDQVQSYAGIRTVGKVQDADGHWRFTLNGDVIFHWGPLDQGWWPDGLLTPPSDEAMLFDIQWLKQAGFNMIRKHIKVEPRRYYYHCDRLGMMVWQDHVSGGVKKDAWPRWTRLKPDPVDAQWPAKHHQQFMRELERMIDTLEDHPSIVCWVPLNEAWGQHQTMEVGKWTVDRDPSRLVNIASGGNFWPVGDIVDHHNYPDPSFPFEFNTNGRFDDYIKVIGEFGGHGYPVKGHVWDANRRNWGYGALPKSEAEYNERYRKSLIKLDELRRQGIAAGVYTQTTDVEGEINGLMTYDRKVIKIPAKELAKLHKVLFER